MFRYSSQINCSISNIFFQFIDQLLPFSLVRFLTNKGFHIFGLKFSSWAQGDASLIPRTRVIMLITIIFNPFDWLYLLLITGKTHSSPGLYVISKFVSLIPLSCKMVFAFERQALKTNASTFKSLLLEFTRAECVSDKRSTTSKQVNSSDRFTFYQCKKQA